MAVLWVASFGLLFAELVNAAKDIAGQGGETRRTEAGGVLDAKLAEIKGFFKGFVLAGALGQSFFKTYGDELSTWIKEEQEPSITEVYELIWRKRQEWLDGIEAAAQDASSSIGAATLAYFVISQNLSPT